MKVPIYQHSDKQVLEIPAAFHIPSGEVYIKQMGNSLVLIPADKPWEALFDSLAIFSEDFLADRKEPKIQTRNFFAWWTDHACVLVAGSRTGGSIKVKAWK
mgnify:CR=1 FL=1